MDLFNKMYSKWCLSGLLLGIGFLQPQLWILGLVGIGLFIHLSSQAGLQYRHVLIGAGIAWTIKYLFSLLWFWSTYPIDWLAVELGNIQIVLIFVYWFTASLWLGMGGVFVAGVVLVLRHYGALTKNHVFILFPVLWLAGELVGSLIFSIITFGPGSVITPAFSFGYIGYLLGEHSVLIQAAQFGGVYILSMLAVALVVSVLLISLIVKKPTLVFGVAVLIYVTGFIPVSNISTTNESFHRVVTIDTAFSVTELRARKDGDVHIELNNAVAAAIELEPDYIILPEDSRLFNQSLPVASAKVQFEKRFNNPSVTIIDSGHFSQRGNENSVIQTFIYDGAQPVGRVQKRYLVPQGEYMPTLYVETLSLLGLAPVVETVAASISFGVGNNTDQSILSDGIPGVLFCFESVNPWGVRAILAEKNKVPFIAHPISHAWFHEPQQLWHQLDTMLRVQAIWNKQYIVSAGGHVAGAMYTPAGSIIKPTTVSSGDGWVVRESLVPKR